MDPSPHISKLATSFPPVTGRAVLSINNELGDPREIIVPNPLRLHEYPETSAGQCAFLAVSHLKNILQDGFQTDHSTAGPTRDIWLRIVSETLAIIHNSIQHTHSYSSLPVAFATLDNSEHPSFDLIVKTLSTLDSFFDDYHVDVDETNLCLRCLHDGNAMIPENSFWVVMKSCDQNVGAAYMTITNNLIRTMTTDLTVWAASRTDEIKTSMISSLTDASFGLALLDVDDKVNDWMTDARNTLCAELRAHLFSDVRTDNADLNTWSAQMAQNIKDELEADFVRHRAERFAELDAQLKREAAEYYNNNTASLKEAADQELAAFKHRLKVETETRKDNAKKTAGAAVKSASRNHPRALTISTSLSNSNRTTRSMSRSKLTTPSQTRDPSPVRSLSTTPKASPAVMAPPSQALTEPLPLASQALSEPLTDMTVGPPENSLEMAMLDIQTEVQTVHHSIHNPSRPITPLEPRPLQAAAPMAANLDLIQQIAAMMDAKLDPISTSIKVLTNRIDEIEDQQNYDNPNCDPPRPYTPSALATTWNPTAEPDKAQHMEAVARQQHEQELADRYQERRDLWPKFLLIEDITDDHSWSDEGVPAEMQLAFRRFLTVHDDFIRKTRPSLQEQLSSSFWDNFAKYWDIHGDSARPAEDLPPPSTDMLNIPPTAKPQWKPSTNVTTINATTAAPTTSGAIDLMKSVPKERAQRPPSPGWTLIDKYGKATSFAKVAARPKPAATTNTATATAPPPADSGLLTKTQANALTKGQLLSIIKDKYKANANSRANKGALVSFVMSLQAKANPIDLVSSQPSTSSQASIPPRSTAPPPSAPLPQRPRARPANQSAMYNTEFTVLASAEGVSMQRPKEKPEDIVRSLRTAINQLHSGGPALVTLLSGRWSSQLSHNFVLTFSGHPTNDQVFQYRSVLTAPFGPGAHLVPQKGYTRIILHGVPLIRRQDGSPETSLTLINEIKRNQVCRDLLIVNAPTWAIRNNGPDKHHSSVTFAYIDEDGSLTQRIIRHPPSIFGATTRAEKSELLPLITQCARCHALGHSANRCQVKRGTTICALCGKTHRTRDHHIKCEKAPHHGSITCNCPPACINCAAAGKSPKGHTAIDHSCPLRKAYRLPNTRTGNSSDEEGAAVTRTVATFETAGQHNIEPGLSGHSSVLESKDPTSSSDEVAGVPPNRVESLPSCPAQVDDDVPMAGPTATPFNLPTSLADFVSVVGISPDHPSFHKLFFEHCMNMLPQATSRPTLPHD